MERTSSLTATTTQLSRIESFQFPRSHVGFLEEKEQQALEEFKILCEQSGYYRPAGQNGQARPSHDDETLLRFLRARKFTTQDALVQFKSTEIWRKENKLEELYETIDLEEYDETRKLYPQWTGRRDKRGIPLYVFEIAGLTSKRMAEYEKKFGKKEEAKKGTPRKLQTLFALYEALIRFVQPLCSAVPNRPYPETPISQSSNIVDISRVGIRQFWALKDHMQIASQLATAHYPETLDRIFIIGAPSFFPTVWSWIKRWFDPITVSKIFILSQSNMKTILESYVDPSNIPKKYGGSLDWEFGQLPYLDAEIDGAITWKNPVKGAKGQNAFPIGPIRWQEISSDKMEAIAVGTDKGTQRNESIAFMPNAHMYAPGVLNKAVDEMEPLEPVTTGIDTHPRDDEEYFPRSGNTPEEEIDEPPLESNPSASNTPTPASTFDSATTATSTTSNPREGTSSTRYKQQEGTHAAGQVAEGTPATVDTGSGDKTTVIEPATVGQAPKDIPMPEPEPEQEPSYIDQAKTIAGQAYETTTNVVSSVSSTVMTAVGYGGVNEEQQEQEAEEVIQKPKEDPKVDSMDRVNVEDFIRSRYTSTTDEN